MTSHRPTKYHDDDIPIRYNESQQQQSSSTSTPTSQLRLRTNNTITRTVSNGTSSTSYSSNNNGGGYHHSHQRVSTTLQHRQSSNDLLEMEGQQRNTSNIRRFDSSSSMISLSCDSQQLEDEDVNVVEDVLVWDSTMNNSSSSSSSEEEDDDEEEVLSVSDSDSSDSVADGRRRRNSTNDVTCGVVDDALLQLAMSDSVVVSSSASSSPRSSLSLRKGVHGTIKTSSHEDSPNDVTTIGTELISSKEQVKVRDDDKNDGNNDDDDDNEYISKKKKRFYHLVRFRRLHRKKKKDTVPAVFDFEQYMLKREMSTIQEKWNALTVLPNPAYCIYYVLSAQWLKETVVSMDKDFNTDDNIMSQLYYMDPTDTNELHRGCFNHYNSNDNDVWYNNINSWWSWHSMPALPPLPVLAVAFAICIHAPFSFIYHWTYAHTMSATQRTKHWSRRMDQSFIHVASAFLCYASSGSIYYFFINALYNLDCIRRQFRPTVRPKRNQMRIIISIIAYTLPLLKHGEYNTFIQLWTLFTMSGYFFLQYPVGGWSHAVFHIIIAFVPPLLLQTATHLPISKEQLYYAASCAQLHQQQQLLK